jgi:WD40 repeat protein
MFSLFRTRPEARFRSGRARRVAASRTRPAVETLEDRSLLSSSSSAVVETLYIGDGTDNTVKMFDAATGTFEGVLVSSGSQNLMGPRGLIFRNDGQLLVVNQNVFLPIPGEVLRYNGINGNPLGALVPHTDPNAPFAPRGMIIGPNHTLFVADMGNLDGIILGRLTRFNSETGAFLGDLQPTGFTGDFDPRAVVIGPDGLLYASVRNNGPTGGEIMRWDPATGTFLGSLVTSDATNDLNRPEGIVFGPDGNIYVTSYRADSADTDKVLEFNGTTGAYIGKIDTDQVGQPREFGQALLFGPDGKLFVPITALGPDSGEVRRYDLSNGISNATYDVFVPPNAQGGPLGQPWYLTFRDTDPATLAFSPGPNVTGGQGVAALTTRTGSNADLAALLAPGSSTQSTSVVHTWVASSPYAAPLAYVAAPSITDGTATLPPPSHGNAAENPLVDQVYADLGNDL